MCGMAWLAVAARFIIGFVAAFLGLHVLLAVVVLVTGGAIFECDRGDCGTVGEWWYEHSRLVLVGVLAAALAVASFAAMRERR
jgi:hypothetical protein